MDTKAIIEKVKAARKQISEMIAGCNTIDRVMRDKVDDYILIEELPLPIRIGDRTIYVGNFTIENQHTFFSTYPKILANIGMQCINFDLMKNTDDMYKALSLHKMLYKDLAKLIKHTILRQQWMYRVIENGEQKKINLRKCSYRYFKRHITMEKLIEICYLVYVYNFDAEKKNVSILLNRLDQSNTSGMYMYSWLQNLVGLSGNFLLDRLIPFDASPDESQIDIAQVIK